jgi:hypothetical protein
MPFGRSRKTKEEMELNGTHQLLVYADDMNMLGHNTETLTEASKRLI